MNFGKAIIRGACILLAAGFPLTAGALSPEETVAEAERAEKGGSLQQAADLYNQFLTANPEHIQRSLVLYKLAICQDNLGQTEKAMETLKQVLAVPADKDSKHRPDAFMRLAKMQADGGKHDEAAATLEKLFKDGAGLYEDEAQNLRAGYLTILGKFDEAAILFNVLRNKPSSPFAKEAAYKLAIVWMKADNVDLAKSAIEEFAQRYPGHPRVVELFIRLARLYYDKKNLKSAVELCQQVMTEFKEAPEAIEAAFIVALSFRDAGKLDVAVDKLEEVARMPQATHNTVLASEALFEAAQICRKSTNKAERACDLYNQAAVKARDGLTERQQQILEQSLFYEAEYYYQQEKWAAAYDLYAQLRKMGSKLNLLSRILQCQSKITADGGANLSADSEEELNFIRQRITENPGTLVALQSEVYLLDRKLEKTQRETVNRLGVPWPALKGVIDGFAALLTNYPAAVLTQQDMRAYVKMRMGTIHTYVAEDDPERKSKLESGIQLLEAALAEAPEALFRVEALESLALLAGRASQNKKAYDTYQKLFAVTGQDPTAKARRPPSEYLQGMVATADTTDLADDAMRTMQDVITKNPTNSVEARDARFYIAELLYMKQRFSESAKSYKEFVRLYGPPLELDGKVSASWKKPPQVDTLLDQVYEAGLRVAHCWRSQGHTTNMMNAYKWVTENQNHMNPRVAEAAYMMINARVNIAKLPADKKEEVARELWTRVVNQSLDFGSKAFKEGFFPWVSDSRAVPFVRIAILKAAQLSADTGNHRRAAEMYATYVSLYDPEDPKKRMRDGTPLYARDEFYFMASYAVGREFVLANDAESMVKAYRGYVDGMRDSKFRAAALQLMGHYGTQVELFADAADAYSALLDEYAPAGSTNVLSKVPVKPEARLRKGSTWNGIRMTAPDKWDAGQIRFGLGFLHWKKEQWNDCQTVLQPFLDSPELRASPSRGEALFMMGRSLLKLKQVTPGQKVLDRLIKDHSDFKGIEEAYLDLARAGVESGNWILVDQYCRDYLAKYPTGERRPYMDVCSAVSQIGRGQQAQGERVLLDLTKADTYEDVKAEAYYRLGLCKHKATPPDPAGALALLRKSVDACPQAPAVLAAARCAVEVRNWAVAREYLDKFGKDFPKADSKMLEEAQQLRKKVMESEAGAKR